MAIAFRAVGTALATGTRSSSVVPIPAGLSAGDEVTIALNAGQSGGTAPTITAPGTATLILSTTWGDGSYTVRSSLYRYRYVGTGDPSSFTFTHSSVVTDGRAIAHSGVDATTPDDVTAVATTSANTGPSFTIVATGVTTVTAGCMVLAWRWSWDGNAITPPGGWTERIDQVITWQGEQLIASAGATGTITIASGSSGGVAPAAAIVRALRPDGGGGSFAVSGTVPIVIGATASAAQRQPVAGTAPIVIGASLTAQKSAAVAGTVPIVLTTSCTVGVSGGGLAVSGTVPITIGTSLTAAQRQPVVGTVPIVIGTSLTATLPGSVSGTVAIVIGTSATVAQRQAVAGTVPIVIGVYGSAVNGSILPYDPPSRITLKVIAAGYTLDVLPPAHTLGIDSPEYTLEVI